MHLALRAQQIEIVHLLLKNGGDTRIEGFNHQSCIEIQQKFGLQNLDKFNII